MAGVLVVAFATLRRSPVVASWQVAQESCTLSSPVLTGIPDAEPAVAVWQLVHSGEDVTLVLCGMSLWFNGHTLWQLSQLPGAIALTEALVPGLLAAAAVRSRPVVAE